MDPFAAKLPRALGPSSISLFFTNPANLICFLCFLAIIALVASVFHNAVFEIFEFFLADFALNAVFTEVSVSMEVILLHFEFSTNFMEHIAALHTGDSLIAE